jgi:DNA-directed RNA polymerase II subunit RPB7
MFYELTLKKELEISPRFFGKKLYEEIERSLRHEVEGSCDGDHGYIVAVTAVEDFGKGRIQEGVGFANFNVRYNCIAFLPHKGEVMDAVVKSVNKVNQIKQRCVHCQIACRETRKAVLGVQANLVYFFSAHTLHFAHLMHTTVASQMGFFAQAGPLDIFVSNHLIPEEYEFDSSNEPCYRTSGEDASDTITAGSQVRLRIVGTRIDAQEIVSFKCFSTEKISKTLFVHVALSARFLCS